MACVAKPTVLPRDPPPHAGFSSSSSNSPNNNQKWVPPSWKPCSPLATQGFFSTNSHVHPSLSCGSQGLGGDTLTLRRQRCRCPSSSNKWAAVRGGPLLFFPASEEEPVRKMERPAGPGRASAELTDAGSCAAPGCQGPALLSAEGPLCPSPSPS